ncbi:SnoaL-like protein [Stackebrandtia albiflava]|uniref:SnoaL-like protein n=1 Tax=Stackebrandtia albiflava TaxID=406432 RepID=A0A562VDA8_9ACTN|nr:nuclear transport factor 2 family protein [Stackebrandtia albiflava]TWJ15860.1 SnoaL-like protein [Stackebrandtia albiflava]
MDTMTAARRWADTWQTAWPRQDVEAIAALQSADGDHYASMFRRYRGRDGLRDYLRECFTEETAPTRCRFATPVVDGDTASVEYWAVMTTAEGPSTISGCTVIRFDALGLVAEARDYSHIKAGEHRPPGHLFPTP